jgi:hypothetical protein
MTGGTGGQRDRGLSSTAGIILFVLIGALLTASGTYLMLEIGSGEIGRTVTTTFDTTQNGETVVIEHTTGSALDSDNLRVVGARVISMPDVVGSGNRIEVRPTETRIELLYEEGRVSQQLLAAEVELVRLVVTVEDERGNLLASRPVGVYDVTSKPTISSSADLTTDLERGGSVPTPTFVGATDEDGEFVTIPATRDGLEAGQEYVVLAATAGPDAERAYAVGSVTINERENVVRLVLPE